LRNSIIVAHVQNHTRHKMYSLGYKLYHFFKCCIYTTRKQGNAFWSKS